MWHLRSHCVNSPQWGEESRGQIMPSIRSFTRAFGHDRSRATYLSVAFGFFLVVVGTLLATEATAGSRPLSDFVNAQGTTNVFIPPVPDYIGWCGEDLRPPIRFA